MRSGSSNGTGAMVVRSSSGVSCTAESTHERLYRKGLIVAARQQIAHEDFKRQESMRKQQETDVMHDCTFHPRINLTSSSVSGRWDTSPDRACERLYNLGKAQEEKRLSLQAALEAEAEEERARFTPRSTQQDQNMLYQRLTKGAKTPRQRERALELRKQPSFAPMLAKATYRLYEQANQRREAQRLRDEQMRKIDQAYAEQGKKALGVIRERGGPSCVSGIKDCTCPGHHHHGAAATGQQSSAPERSTTPSTLRGMGPRRVSGASNRLLAIPAHRLQDRFVDPMMAPHSARNSNQLLNQHPPSWPTDSPFFAHLAQTQTEASYHHHPTAVSEPQKGRLSLEDLERHERLMREIEKN